MINIHTNDPQMNTNSGRVFSEYGRLSDANNTALFRAQGIANVAISSDAAARVNVFYVKDTALQKNVVPDPNFDGGLRQIGGSAKLLWEPTSQFSILFAGDYMDSKGSGGGVASFRNVTPTSPMAVFLPPLGVMPGFGNSKSAYNGPTFYNLDVGGGQAKASYEFAGGLRLTNILAYRGFRTAQAFDADYGPLDLVQFFGGGIHVNQLSDELRLTSPTAGRLDYQVGLFGLRARVKETAQLAASLGQPIPPGFTTLLGADNFWRQLLGSYAAYGQATYRFTDQLKLTAGARLTHDTINMRYENTTGGGVVGLLPLAPDRQQSRSETNFSWRVQAQYDLQPDWMVYGYPWRRATKALGMPNIRSPTCGRRSLRTLRLGPRRSFSTIS